MTALCSEPTLITADPRWQAVLARDPTASFFFSVATTGIVCRPSCPARRPFPQHVRFHVDVAEALAAGYRPCQRCRPTESPLAKRHARLIARLCRYLDTAVPSPTLEQMARLTRQSPSHLARLFRAHTGLTPRQYLVGLRRAAVQHQLIAGSTVTTALFEAGFNSSSRFYARSTQDLGMTPSTLRSGAPSVTIHFALGHSSLGLVLVARTQRGLCAILLGDDADVLRADLKERFPKATLLAGEDDFQQTLDDVIVFVEAPRLGLALALDLQGTVFQQRVWQALQQVPPGTTATYAEVAARLGQPTATRAVAGACAANPLAIAVPCHRVLRADGSLSGYRWGTDRKQALLTREASDQTDLPGQRPGRESLRH